MGAEKDFDGWNTVKQKLENHIFTDFVHAREVWWCALGINVGSEQDGDHSSFERPILILRKFNKDVVLAVPLTTRIKKNPFYVRFTHQGEEYAALISQIRLISTKRLKRRLYRLDSAIFNRIRTATREMI